MEREGEEEAGAPPALTVAAQKIEVVRSLMEDDRRMLLDRIQPLQQPLASAFALEAMAERLLRVEQQCSIKTAHQFDNVETDAGERSAAVIHRLEALESTCQTLLHGKNILGSSSEAANNQQDFAQLRSCMQVLQELLREGLAEERAERTKALHEAKQHVDECFESVDCRLAVISSDRIGDASSEAGGGGCAARLAGELKAELRADLADHVQALTAELRGKVLGELAVREGEFAARMKLLDTRVTGDLKMSCRDLSMRIDLVEEEVRKNSKLVTEMEVRLPRAERSESPCRQSPPARAGETPLGRRTFPTKGGSVASAGGSRTGSVCVQAAQENEDESAVKIVRRGPTDGSSRSLSPTQNFRAVTNFTNVTNQLDPETSSTETVVRISGTESAAIPSILCRRPNVGNADIASNFSRKLAQHHSSRQTTNFTVCNGSASKGTSSSTMALRPRNSSLPTEPRHPGGTSPGASPIVSFRSLPNKQNLMNRTLSGVHISSRVDEFANKATIATLGHSVSYQPMS